ncbi:MAG TPA: M23 family metallopeptidase [Clostridia bacterium]|nr:M23 family metallopeptidase [Clostridia bacterium]
MRERKKIALLAILLFFFLTVVGGFYCAGYPGIRLTDIDSRKLTRCLAACSVIGADWRAVWAYCSAKGFDANFIDIAVMQASSGQKGKEWLSKSLNGIALIRAIREYNALDKADRILDYLFPIDPKYGYAYTDSWGAERTWGRSRSHEGTDIICLKGTPIRSVCDGIVEKRGWNIYGGWRVGIRGKDGLYYYYAHLSGFNVVKGQQVSKGDVIGYAGDSGYGALGQTGEFPVHLHFAIYEDNIAFNPYPFLAEWERRYKIIAR